MCLVAGVGGIRFLVSVDLAVDLKKNLSLEAAYQQYFE
jgi:hypothetical protein